MSREYKIAGVIGQDGVGVLATAWRGAVIDEAKATLGLEDVSRADITVPQLEAVIEVCIADMPSWVEEDDKRIQQRALATGACLIF